MTHTSRDQLLLAAQAHGLYLRLRERVEMGENAEAIAWHAYSRYIRRLQGGFRR